MPRDLPQLRQRIVEAVAASTARCCNVCGRNFITGLTSAASPRVDISSTCKVGQNLGVCHSVDMLLFGMTILATIPQRSEIPEGRMNYTVFIMVLLARVAQRFDSCEGCPGFAPCKLPSLFKLSFETSEHIIHYMM
jgi:hypothetical protein